MEKENLIAGALTERVLDGAFAVHRELGLKAIDRLLPIHEAQLITYLRLSGIRVGLLLDFNVRQLRHGLKRLVV